MGLQLVPAKFALHGFFAIEPLSDMYFSPTTLLLDMLNLLLEHFLQGEKDGALYWEVSGKQISSLKRTYIHRYHMYTCKFTCMHIKNMFCILLLIDCYINTCIHILP